MTNLLENLRVKALGIAAAGLLAAPGVNAVISVDADDGTVDGIGMVEIDKIVGIGTSPGGLMWPVVDFGDGTGFEFFQLNWTGYVAPPGNAFSINLNSATIVPVDASFVTGYFLPLTFTDSANPLGGWTYTPGGGAITCFDGTGTGDGVDCDDPLIGTVVTGGGTGNLGDGDAFFEPVSGPPQSTIIVHSEVDPDGSFDTGLECDFIFDNGNDLCELDSGGLFQHLNQLTTSAIVSFGFEGNITCDMVNDEFEDLKSPTGNPCQRVLSVASSFGGGGQDQGIVFSRGVPEPSTLALLGLGLLGLGVTARRRNAV